MIDTRAERHFLSMVTPAAILGCVGRVHFDSCSASFFRFDEQLLKKSRPCCICNALRQTMIVNHPVHVQVFDTDHTETIDDLSTFLVGEGIPSEGDTLVNTSNNLAVFASLRCAFRQLGVLTLYFRQSLFFFAEEAGVRDLFSIGERGKGLESDVNTDLFRAFWQSLRFALTREGDIPLSGTTPTDGTGFDGSLDGAVIDHFDTANLGECHAVIMRETEAALGEGEAIVAVSASEARETRIFTLFHTSEERFKGQ